MITDSGTDAETHGQTDTESGLHPSSSLPGRDRSVNGLPRSFFRRCPCCGQVWLLRLVAGGPHMTLDSGWLDVRCPWCLLDAEREDPADLPPVHPEHQDAGWLICALMVGAVCALAILGMMHLVDVLREVW